MIGQRSPSISTRASNTVLIISGRINLCCIKPLTAMPATKGTKRGKGKGRKSTRKKTKAACPAEEFLYNHGEIWVNCILPFVGPGNHAFVVGVNRRMRELYHKYFATINTPTVAVSIPTTMDNSSGRFSPTKPRSWQTQTVLAMMQAAAGLARPVK